MATKVEPLFTISSAHGADAARAAALHATCFDDPWRSELIARVLGTPGGFGFIARSEGALAGFVLCRSAANEGEVLTLCVATERRRRGIARGLMHAVLSEARRRQLRVLFLEVAEDNRAARALYQIFGFAQVGRRPAYYRLPSGASVDALTLRCVMHPSI